MKTLPVTNAKWEVLPPYMTPAKVGEAQIETNVYPIGYACDVYAEGEHAGKVAAYRVPINYTGDKGRAEECARALNGYAAAVDALRAMQATALQVNDRQWAQAIERAKTDRPCDLAAAVLAAHDGGKPAPVNPPTAADLENLRTGCFDLYWPDHKHAFAVSVRDAIETIERS